MAIYMIRAGGHGPVKIGFAEDVARRMTKMQADNHERLSLIRLLEGGLDEEAGLHVRFADHRLHGEWFSFTRLMLGDLALEDLAPSITASARDMAAKLARRTMGEPRSLSVPHVKSPCCDLIESLGGHAAVAAFCSCGAPAISNWKKKGIPKSRWPDLYFAAQKQGLVLELDAFEKINERILRAAA